MTNDNPFAAPKAWSEYDSEREWPGSFEIIGQQILCGRSVLLPPVCVETGQTTDLVSQHQSLCFPWYRLVVSQRWVNCHFFLHRPRHARRVFVRRTAAVVHMIGWSLLFGPFVLGLAGIVNLIGLVPIGGLLLLIGRMITVFFASSRLRLASTVNQRQSLICGFSPEFFKSLEALSD